MTAINDLRRRALIRPAPAEVTERNQVEWRSEVAAGSVFTAELAFSIEHPKDLEISGWR